jgi:hypothetical protein
MSANSMDIESIDSEEDKQGLLDPNLRSVRRWSNNTSRSGRCHTFHLVVLYMVNFTVTISLLWSILHKKDPSTYIYCTSFYGLKSALRY